MARSPTSADERDRYPRKTPPKGHPAAELAVPHHVEERGTGVVEGEELRAVRERRPTPQRVAHLELRVDGLASDIGEVKGTVGEVKGTCDGIRDALDGFIRERHESRKFWRAVALKVVGGVFSGSVLAAILRAAGVL